MIEVTELRKVFPTTDGGEKRAVDGLSFRVETGEIYGLLGPNGAGKTTTLRMIGGLLAPTSGSARLNGCDIQTQREEAKRSLGYLTASTGLYHRLSPREMLRYFGELIGMEPAAISGRFSPNRSASSSTRRRSWCGPSRCRRYVWWSHPAGCVFPL